MAAKALEERQVVGLGFGAPGVNNSTGIQCKAWIDDFMEKKMQQRPDGQWIILVDGITRGTVEAIHNRVALWKSKEGSASYLNTYNKFVAALLNAIRLYPE